MITIAAAQYPIERLADWSAFTTKIEKWVAKAKDKGAQLLLLPEYAGIEITNAATDDDIVLFQHLNALLPQYIAFYQELALHYQMYIQPGSIPIKTQGKIFNNRAYFFGPNESYGYQDKLQLVVSEKASPLEGGKQQTLFKTSLGLIGIAVCYDSEFPEIVRNLVKQGATLILVPSYTPTLASFNRVYYSCRARAIENQCYVMMTSAIGKEHFTNSLNPLVGQANVFSPIDVGFPDDGVLQQGKMNKEMMIVGNLDLQKIVEVREMGAVLNFKDFQSYSGHDFLFDQKEL